MVGAQHNKPRRPGKPKPPPTDGASGNGSGSGSGISDRPCDAYNFNGPYISGAATGSLTVTRVLTSVVASKEGRLAFTAQGAPDPGSQFDVVVAPAAVRLRGGESQKVTITVKPRSGTPPNEYQFGEVSSLLQPTQPSYALTRPLTPQTQQRSVAHAWGRVAGFCDMAHHRQGWCDVIGGFNCPSGSPCPCLRCTAQAVWRSSKSHAVRIPVLNPACACLPLFATCTLQVVWRSSKGHVVRIPIAVTFSEFVAPAILEPVLRLPDFQHR